MIEGIDPTQAKDDATRRKVWSALGSIGFLVAPGIVAGLLPGSISQWRLQPWPVAGMEFRMVGAVIGFFGFACLLDSFTRFALQGLGTPAPIFPARHLVVSGGYRFVRNPMYLAVLAIIFGQALVFANVTLALYGVGVAASVYIFVKLYEEPTLGRAFGRQYQTYRANVPSWRPRLRPWRGG